MLTTQALPVILAVFGTNVIPGVSALPGTGFLRRSAADDSTDTTKLVDNGPYVVSVPDGLRILELFHTEVPKNRNDTKDGSYLGTVNQLPQPKIHADNSFNRYADDPAHFTPSHAAAPIGACAPSVGEHRCSNRYDYPASAEVCKVLLEDILGGLYRGAVIPEDKIGKDHQKVNAISVPEPTSAERTPTNVPISTKTISIPLNIPTAAVPFSFYSGQPPRQVPFFPYGPRSVCLSVPSTQKQCCITWADNLRHLDGNATSVVEGLPHYFFETGKKVLDNCALGEYVYGKVQDTRIGQDCTTQCISGDLRSGCWREA
ncbi:hypothetical protein B0T20DRAFT_467313 [Sordaria brevicollis]|uniref:Uncharacterized protein n=1 Tax=Sordaria brevicollis TaxID=83679 RepID=A0AAE0PIA2_SORBR|nr:hypothetical protein B0T20DRAFT_467313 [Sordaria brevicollis]